MRPEQDGERELRWWLAGPLDQLPDRYLDAALEEISTTQQRRRSWPAWRLSEMNSSARYLLAAVAAVIVVAVGVALLRPGGGFGGPGTPTPAPSGTAAATATSLPTPVETQVAAAAFVDPFTITVPAGWSSGFTDAHKVGTYTGSTDLGYWGVSVYARVRLYSDPCHPSAGFTAPGEFATPADLVSALEALPGLTVNGSTSYASPGHSGLRIDWQYTADAGGCELGNGLVLVYATNLNDHDLGINGGYQQRWFVTSVRGQVLVIEAWTGTAPLTDRMAQLQPIIDSITFE